MMTKFEFPAKKTCKIWQEKLKKMKTLCCKELFYSFINDVIGFAKENGVKKSYFLPK